jgi:DNA-binding transcriptional LysR family regulator
LVRLGERAPDVQVHLTVANSDAVCDAVLRHEVQVGLVETGRTPAGLQSVVVATDRLVLVVDPRHPWATRARPVMPAELGRTPLAIREAGSGTRRILDEALAATGHAPVPAAYELSSNAAVRICAATGAAPAVLSELAVRDAVERKELTVVPTRQLDLSRRIQAVWTGGRRPVGPTALLLSCTRQPAR